MYRVYLSVAVRVAFVIVSAASVCVSGCIMQQAAKDLARKQAARFVEVVKPAVGPLVENVAFVGFVEPRLAVNAHFLLPGRIESCRVREGDLVKQGEEICHLDMSAVNLEVVRAENSVKAAKTVMETNLPAKQKALFEAGMIGQAEFEQVRVQAEGAKAQFADASSLYEMAQKKKGEHFLLAPWDGVVTRLMVKPGQPVVPEMPVAILSDERSVQIGVDMHAAYFSKVSVGSSGKLLTISSRPVEELVALSVAEKAIAVNPESQSFHLVIRPEKNSMSDLVPGVLVTGEIQTVSLDFASHIPQRSLVKWDQSGNASVFVVENGKLASRQIRTGIMAGKDVQVLQGLDTQSQIVMEPAPDFVEGMDVRLE
jgi:RND family efflux transporter MFP subunit